MRSLAVQPLMAHNRSEAIRLMTDLVAMHGCGDFFVLAVRRPTTTLSRLDLDHLRLYRRSSSLGQLRFP